MVKPRVSVHTERLHKADELLEEKKFVQIEFPNIPFKSWKYGEVTKIDNIDIMAANFVAVPGTYILFNSYSPSKANINMTRREVLKETYRKVGGRLKTLNLVVAWRVMNTSTLMALGKASELLQQQGYVTNVFNRWINLQPGNPGYEEMETNNEVVNTIKRLLAGDDTTKNKSRVSDVEFRWSPVYENMNYTNVTDYNRYYLGLKVHISHA